MLSSFWQVLDDIIIQFEKYLHICIIYRLWRWYFQSYFKAHAKIQIWRKNLLNWRKIFLKNLVNGVHWVCFFQVSFYIYLFLSSWVVVNFSNMTVQWSYHMLYIHKCYKFFHIVRYNLHKIYQVYGAISQKYHSMIIIIDWYKKFIKNQTSWRRIIKKWLESVVFSTLD